MNICYNFSTKKWGGSGRPSRPASDGPGISNFSVCIADSLLDTTKLGGCGQVGIRVGVFPPKSGKSLCSYVTSIIMFAM